MLIAETIHPRNKLRRSAPAREDREHCYVFALGPNMSLLTELELVPGIVLPRHLAAHPDHEPPLTRPKGHPLPLQGGEGMGVRGDASIAPVLERGLNPYLGLGYAPAR